MTDFGRRPPVCPANVLPKTGQTISYRDGDDGYHEAGWEGDRWTDNGDGTLTDNATGLMWPDDLNNDGGNNGAELNWNAAIDYASALPWLGYGDWRLPNFLELASLMDYHPGTMRVTDVIQNAQAASLWTSTTNALFPANAWLWWMGVDSFFQFPKTNTEYLLCCRTA